MAKRVLLQTWKVRDFEFSGEVCEFYKLVTLQEYTSKFLVLDSFSAVCKFGHVQIKEKISKKRQRANSHSQFAFPVIK